MRNVRVALVIAILSLGLVALYLVLRERRVVALTEAPPVTTVTSRNTNVRPKAQSVSPTLTPTVATPGDQSSKTVPANTVALVNGVPITASQLDDELSNILISPAAHGALSQQQKDAPRKAALEELIVRELAYQRAKADGLVVKKNEIAATVKKIKRRYQTEKSFQEALKAEEISAQEFERRIEKDLLLRKISKLELEDKARVSDEEMRRYYESNKAKFIRPESLRLFRIVIKVALGKEAEAKRKIDDVYAKLKAGADFGETAYKFSEDEYRVMSGDYGTVHRGQLPAELETVVFAAKPSELSLPFETDDGWQVIRTENKQTERQLRFVEVREKIKTALFEQQQRQRRLDFIASLKAEAKIEYLTR